MRKHLPGKRISVCALAWKAAARVSGTSIHWWAGVNVGKLEVSAERALSFIESRSDPEVVFRRYRECNVFVIDEVSQMHPKVLDSLEHFARLVKKSDLLFGGIQVVLSGDFFPDPACTLDGPARALLL